MCGLARQTKKTNVYNFYIQANNKSRSIFSLTTMVVVFFFGEIWKYYENIDDFIEQKAFLSYFVVFGPKFDYMFGK